MNPIFKNALALTLLLSVVASVKAADQASTPTNMELLRSGMVVALGQQLGHQVIGGVKSGANYVAGAAKATPDTLKSAYAYTCNGVKATPGAVRAASQATAKAARVTGAYLISVPVKTEGAHLGGYLTTANALNVSAKVGLAAVTVYGLKKLYDWYATPTELLDAHIKAYEALEAHKQMVASANATSKLAQEEADKAFAVVLQDELNKKAAQEKNDAAIARIVQEEDSAAPRVTTTVVSSNNNSRQCRTGTCRR